MADEKRVRQALQRFWKRAEEERWIYGTLGKKETDGNYTFTVPGRNRFLYVTMRTANGAQTVVPARNDASVEHAPNTEVRMLFEKGVYVIHGKSGNRNLTSNNPTPPTGVLAHNHDERYFREDEHLNASAGVADAGKPIKLNASGEVDTSMLPPGLDPVEDQILAASTDDTIEDTDVFGYVTGTSLVKTTWSIIKSTLKTYLDAFYGLLAGNNLWTGLNEFEDRIAIDQLTFTGHAFAVYRNLAAANTDGALVNFTQDNAGDDQALLYLQQDGTGALVNGYLGSDLVFQVTSAGVLAVNNTGGTQVVAARFVNGAGGAQLVVRKSRGATPGTHGLVSNNDTIGAFGFQGSDGSGYVAAATILVAVDGTPGSNDMPGRIEFRTTNDGASTPSDKGFVNSAGQWHIGSLSSVGANKLGIQAGNSNNDAAAGGVLYAAFSDAGNSLGGEDTLHSYSVPADTLYVNGQSLWFEASGITAANANTKTIRLSFGGVNVVAIASAFGSAATDWSIRGRIVRTGGATQRVYGEIHTGAGSTAMNYADLTATLSGPVTISVTGESSGGITNDVICKTFIIGWDDINS